LGLFPFTDKFGAAMTLVKSDIGGNITVRIFTSSNFINFSPSTLSILFFRGINCKSIFKFQRLEKKYLSDPSKYEHLYNMVQEEVVKKTAKDSSSCTNGLLWLTR
jgi:Glycolipid transfer protein (GLTP)